MASGNTSTSHGDAASLAAASFTVAILASTEVVELAT